MPNSEVEFWRTYTKKTVESNELFLPRFLGLCSVSIMTSGHGNKVDSNIENLFELLSVAKPIRVLVRTDKFREPIELLGSKSDSGNKKRHPIGPAFSKNSTACTRGFSSPIPSLWERKTSGSQDNSVIKYLIKMCWFIIKLLHWKSFNVCRKQFF